ncbi:LysR substrate-binding domain-containing protein [Mesorhizobium delmotii]|uniref:Transcriptional regulator LysR family n=1 Tax=Mesorhizobium delmotii TaxID=1631247 RepID=A0A2P9AG72_9HYPH|nr:LysR substrate-binding domain-containing protein [Mesorhizobium delmotii]SJM30138.1 Transcriptional regulator LysR family [Mesorhizobium delmotii]
MQQRLPPLKSLIALESVVRTGSVTAAAKELFVTHSAVSKHIKALETWVGEALFAENRRHMAPLPAAVRLSDSVGMAINLISQSLSTLFEETSEAQLRVIAPATFSMRWLIPRLPEFHSAHKTTGVRVRQTHTPENWHDIPFDVAIRRGGPVPPSLKSVVFLREELTLVCHPRLAGGRAPGFLAIEEIPLLKADTRPGELETWLLAASAPLRLASGAASFPHFYIALEAALAGQGAIVAPLLVIEDLLLRGDLVELEPNVRVRGADYMALYEESASTGSPKSFFVSWLASMPPKTPPVISPSTPSHINAL